MVRRIKLIHEIPNVENTIPVSLYQSSSPEKFSVEDDDKFVLYAGGSGYKFEILNNDPTHDLNINGLELQKTSLVSLFVLNTSFIIWFEELNKGLDINYQSIILHALQTNSQLSQNPILYLQLLSNDYLQSLPKQPTEFVSSIELVITTNNDGKPGPNEQNPLFTVQEQSSLTDIYDALSECSSFHDSEDEDENIENPMSQFASIDEVSQPALEVPSSWLQDGGEAISMDTEYETHESIPFRNSGDADDLEIDELYEEPNNGAASNQVAGMHVDVGFAPIVGSVRRRDDNETSEDEFSKTRRLR
ncbi:protein LOT5 [Hyphopichia burtonii NRRL Y-1933]|uniref:Protein LOT5 n=1 Tax=Hyphopichia burtonii NRRL Y-1933 TaxID=984485 RepID=A0A1E4RQC9_9ASCO|nr:protein LOT5 [Hyphopichia burtonii NRRL Y-1933]ODV69480.1 protein LOT5 [Hyphopichia burtonii NRRL Y-1933]